MLLFLALSIIYFSSASWNFSFIFFFQDIVVVGTDRFDRTRWLSQQQQHAKVVPAGRLLPPLAEEGSANVNGAPLQSSSSAPVNERLSPLSSPNQNQGVVGVRSSAATPKSQRMKIAGDLVVSPATIVPGSKHSRAQPHSGRMSPAKGSVVNNGGPSAVLPDGNHAISTSVSPGVTTPHRVRSPFSPLPPLPPIGASQQRAASPELAANSEFVPSEEPQPNVVESYLLQALAPSVRAQQERERQQRGYRLKMSVRAKSRLDNGAAIIQQQQDASIQLAGKIEVERRRQQLVLEAKIAQRAMVPSKPPIDFQRVRFGATLRIILFLARWRRSRAHRRATAKDCGATVSVNVAISSAAVPNPDQGDSKATMKPKRLTVDNNSSTISNKGYTARSTAGVSRPGTPADFNIKHKAASLIQAHVRGFLARREVNQKLPVEDPEEVTSPAPPPSKLSPRGIVDPMLVEQHYSLLGKLGDGNFAIVKACEERSTGKKFAMKVIDKSKTKGLKESAMVENEVRVMRMLDHPNVIKLYDVFDTPAQLYLVLELVEGGDLFDRIVSKGKYNEPDAIVLVHSMATAIQVRSVIL